MIEATLNEKEAAEERLKKELMESIRQFSLNRTTLLEKAHQEGGLEAVTRLQDQYDDLRDSYRAILGRQLDRNNHRYAELMADAAQEVAQLKEMVHSFQSTEKVLEGAAKAIAALGRILIVLG